MPDLTKEQFLARCANAFDAGLITLYRMLLMSRWLDVVMREGHSRVTDFRGDQGEHRYYRADQWDYVRSFWHGHNGEMHRLLKDSPPGQDYVHTLSNDADGYALQELAAILTHPCQICATSSRDKAWWTRAGFCPHCQVTIAEEIAEHDAAQKGDEGQ